MDKLYTLSVGNTTEYGVADSEESMRESAGDIDPRFSYLPVKIDEVKVEGYEITLTPLTEDKPKNKGGRPKKEA
jgi:hypothetical protein